MTRSRICVTLLAITLLSPAGGAQVAEKIFPFPVSVFQLDNGLRVVGVDYVNAAIRRHLQADDLAVAIVTRDAEAFRDELLSGAPSTVTYNTEVGDEILAEDEEIKPYPLAINADRVRVVPVEEMFVEVS